MNPAAISSATYVIRLARAAVTLAPLAVLSAGWTVHLALPDSHGGTRAALPVGVIGQAPLEAPLDLPASATRPATMGHTRLASVHGPTPIPAQAVAGYQRAEAVLAGADPGCHLPWTLLAAIGRVESDHGRRDGGSLDANGMATPALVGPALDGAGGVDAVPDTDGGELDGDVRWDRAVGPLQFLPTTWATVGVDADGDGRRSPQDIDDAAVGAAVHLCSDDQDLATGAGLHRAVLRYNHDPAYVEVVLRLHASYAAAPASLTGGIANRLGVGTLISAAPARPGAAGAVRPPRGAGGPPAAPVQPAPPTASAVASQAAAAQADAPAGAATPSPTSQVTAETGCPAPVDAGTGPAAEPTTGPTAAATSGPSPSPTASPSAEATSGPSASPAPTSTGDAPAPTGTAAPHNATC